MKPSGSKDGTAGMFPSRFHPSGTCPATSSAVRHRARHHGARGGSRRNASKLIEELTYALAKIKTLKGLLPICASCKKIRDDGGYWQKVESYLSEHTDAEFTHGLCPDCLESIYPDTAAEKLPPTPGPDDFTSGFPRAPMRRPDSVLQLATRMWGGFARRFCRSRGF